MGRRRLWSALAGIGALAGALAAPLPGAVAEPSEGAPTSYLVVARGPAEFAGLQRDAARHATVVDAIPELSVVVVEADSAGAAALARDARTAAVARPRVTKATVVDGGQFHQPGPANGRQISAVLPARREAAAPRAVNPDPAFSYRGLMWNYNRIGAQQAWQETLGSRAVTVAVADTGVDFTHSELGPNVTQVVDLTTRAEREICRQQTGFTDEQLARRFGGPATTDWHGHGSWIGGNIAAALDGRGINGIAPRVNMVALKIAQNCGTATDIPLLRSFVWAANHDVDVVSISFGGYLDRSDPEQEQIWQLYRRAVAYAKSKGTMIVASAGNDHIRLGAQGRVISHGFLNPPGGPYFDAFGVYQVPGGVPGVVIVSSTNNVVVPSSPHCPPGTIGSGFDPSATCKPVRDRHQAAGQGLRDQLAYYSNYGPRIDIAAPGGARKFNLPVWDRGGTPGFPVTNADLTNAYEEFSTTSNWATQIPCYTFTEAAGFPRGQCYTTIQGTSMATPHVSAAVALIASANPQRRGDVNGLLARLKTQVRHPQNRTQVLSPTDRSPGDLTPWGRPCAGGWCHLGGEAVSNADAYGAGLLHLTNP